MDINKIKDIMFDMFDRYDDCDDIIDDLRSLNSCEELTDDEYDYCLENWDELLSEYKNQ